MCCVPLCCCSVYCVCLAFFWLRNPVNPPFLVDYACRVQSKGKLVSTINFSELKEPA